MVTTKARAKGYEVRVELSTLPGGIPVPERIPGHLMPLLVALSESPDVEYVQVVRNGMHMMGALAPRDAEAVANLIQARAPGVAALLRKSHDAALAAEIRRLAAGPDEELPGS